MSAQDPFSLLQQMQADSMSITPDLPEEAQAANMWSGIGFRIGNVHLLAPLDQVSEVLRCPDYAVVPGTRKWLRGIANVRGNLITIVDMAEYFGKEPVFLDDHARLMVMNIEELNTALLVNDVFGLRHFDEDEDRRDLPGLGDSVDAHITGAFLRDNILWGIFDMESLASSGSFQNVGT